MTDSSPYTTIIADAPLSGPALRELTRATLGRGLPFRFTAHGYSMTPFIQDGDVITVAPLTAPPTPGVVVAFVNPHHQRLTVHRVVALTPEGYLVRGDNLAEPDGLLTDADLLGRVVQVKRNGRPVAAGLGRAGPLLAHLSRLGLLWGARQALFLPRRGAGMLLRWLQSLPAYRHLGRHWQPAVRISEVDMAGLAEVQRRLSPELWHPPPRPNPLVTPYAAHVGGLLAGFVELVRHPPAHAPYVGHWLFSLHVWTAFRGLGVGEQLTRQVIRQAQAEGAAALLLVVNEDNAPAIRLYRKLGFVHVAMPELDRRFAQANPRRLVMRIVWQEAS